MTKPEDQLRDFLLKILSNICRKTKSPKVSQLGSILMFEVQVDAHDQGRCVGKRGAVFAAINTLMWYAGIHFAGHTVGVKLLEPESAEGDRRPVPFMPNPQWDRIAIGNVIDQIGQACFGCKFAFVLQEENDGQAEAKVQIPARLRTSAQEPDFEKALGIIIRAIGMMHGVSLKTSVTWK
jgi:predicted RNA-binding protein YlqC (UPF0109 family)